MLTRWIQPSSASSTGRGHDFFIYFITTIPRLRAMDESSEGTGATVLILAEVFFLG